MEATARAPMLRLFADGVVVSVFNPKIAVFFLAFLPQFVDVDRGPAMHQIMLLGLIYCALALITDGAYALLAGRARRFIAGQMIQGPLPRYVSGSIYLGLGVTTGLAGRGE